MLYTYNGVLHIFTNCDDNISDLYVEQCCQYTEVPINL